MLTRSLPFFLLLLISSASILSSCKSKKKLTENIPIDNSCVGKNLHLDSIGLLPDSAAFSWYKIKGSANIQLNKETYDIDIQLRIKPNDTIWISLSKAGFPVAKILLKKDSIFALDLFHKEYFKSDYPSLGEKIGVAIDFKIAQSILLGQFIPFNGSKHQWIVDHELVVSNQQKDSLQYFQDSTRLPRSLLWAQWMDCSSGIVNKQFVKTVEKEEIWVKYNAPDESTPLKIPTVIEVNTFRAGIQKLFSTLEYKRFKVSPSLNVPFNIPEDYAEMQ